MLLACGARQILENMEFVLLCSSMFGIPLLGFILPLIDDWRLVMQVNIRQSFFHQSFAAAFITKLPNFFTAKVFYHTVSLFRGRY